MRFRLCIKCHQKKGCAKYCHDHLASLRYLAICDQCRRYTLVSECSPPSREELEAYNRLSEALDREKEAELRKLEEKARKPSQPPPPPPRQPAQVYQLYPNGKKKPISDPLSPRNKKVRERSLLILSILARKGGVSYRELGTMVGLRSSATVHEYISSLVERGFLEKEGRYATMSLRVTDAGRTVLEQADRVRFCPHCHGKGVIIHEQQPQGEAGPGS